jgi:hypothetical protein
MPIGKMASRQKMDIQSNTSLYKVKEELFLIFGGHSSLEVLDVQRDICKTFSMPEEMVINAVLNLDRVYIFSTNDIFQFSVDQMELHYFSKINEKIEKYAYDSKESHFIVAGGLHNGIMCRKVFKIDQNMKFQKMPPMVHRRKDFSITIIPGQKSYQILAVGGCEKNVFEIFCSKKNSWTTL